MSTFQMYRNIINNNRIIVLGNVIYPYNVLPCVSFNNVSRQPIIILIPPSDLDDLYKVIPNMMMTAEYTLIVFAASFKVIKQLDNDNLTFIKDIQKIMFDVLENVIQTYDTYREKTSFVGYVINAGFDTAETLALVDRLLEQEVTRRFVEAKARIIQRAFRKAIVDPTMQLCRNRLLHEFYSI